MNKKIVNKEFQAYYTRLVEEYRSPSRGGNTKAQHWHSILIDNTYYSFFALGSKKFAYKGETVSFEYKEKEKDGKVYFDVIVSTFTSKDKHGNTQIRGNRGYKPVLRTARQKAPTSGRERD